MTHEIEGFEKVIGYPTYLINRTGKVWSILSGKFIKPQNNGIGYMQYFLKDYTTGKIKQLKSHRLVGLQFIPNPNNYTEINHKDGIKSNNDVDNLEWCTHSQNILHSFEKLGRIHIGSYLSKKIKCSNGKEYASAILAANDTGCKTSNISMCCNGKIKHTKKLTFEFK